MKKPYVAIVDDDASFAAYLRTFLSLRGYEARCYTRGDELLASMKQTEPPDVVLLDVMMPGLDGLATLRALKASRPEAQVIVLIRGESGVGKELVARAIHQRSTRRNRPFVKVNCAALPAELLESELFGHERGAFTGAANTRIGKFEQADTGTLMMDEIGELKPALQAKLLHVLQDAEFTKLGSNKRIQVDVRVVAATNRDLEKMLVSGDFREDLYYRLKVIELTVPALSERRDEIPTLTDFFTARYSRKYNRPARPISDELRHLFAVYEWPGNIRELENMIKRVVILQDEQLVVREIQRNMQRVAAAPALAGAVPLAAGAAPGADGVPVRGP